MLSNKYLVFNHDFVTSKKMGLNIMVVWLLSPMVERLPSAPGDLEVRGSNLTSGIFGFSNFSFFLSLSGIFRERKKEVFLSLSFPALSGIFKVNPYVRHLRWWRGRRKKATSSGIWEIYITLSLECNIFSQFIIY